GLSAAAMLLLYAAFIDWDMFWWATHTQASVRSTHWNVFVRFFTEPMINHNRLGAGWLVFLWLGFAFAIPRLERHHRAVMTVPVVVYLAAIAIPSGSWSFGWYILPVYPFLCLGAGKL